MDRNMFSVGFYGNNGRPAGIPVYQMTRQQVDQDRGNILRRLPVPPGMTVEFPYIVKIDGEGEYIVQADGTAVFFSYRNGRSEPPEVVENKAPWMGRREGGFMDGWMDVTFQRAWFGAEGPFMAPARLRVPIRSGPPVARNWGPLDGPLTESIHAQWFAQRPLVHPAQQLQSLEGSVPNLGQQAVFCPTGQMPVQTGVPGQSQCIPFSPPSQMIGPSGNVGEIVPPNYPQRTFPVRPFWGWQNA